MLMHCHTFLVSRVASSVNIMCTATITPAVLAMSLSGKSHQDIRNCLMEDELIGPKFWTKFDGINPSANTVKGCDPNLVQILDQLIIKDELL